MFYIHQNTCISPQQTFLQNLPQTVQPVQEDQLRAIEPGYEGIPPGVLRRMGKASRMGIGAALPLLKQEGIKPDGFILGTANGGMEDAIKFLKQIVEYDEGVLTPGNFVQSTPNAIAGQLGLFSKNTGYNITHVHGALSFENAVLDADMLLNEFPAKNYLLGGVDEISSFNYNIDCLAGWYRKNVHTEADFYAGNSEGAVAGEGAAMFLVGKNPAGAVAQVKAVSMLHSSDPDTVSQHMATFLHKYLPPGETIDTLLSGENGDTRFARYYKDCEAALNGDPTILRFKHLSGEYATATATAVWLAAGMLQTQRVPQHMIKKAGTISACKNLLIYNQHKNLQHSWMLLSAV